MTSSKPGRAPRNRSARTPPPNQGTDLFVLLTLLGLTAVLYLLAGPAGFSAIISAGVGLYVTWRGKK
jgi:hypothetical protein